MGVDGLPAGFPGSFDGFQVQWGLEPSVRRNAKSAGRIVKGGVGEGAADVHGRGGRNGA